MYKVAILGTENTHADGFCRMILSGEVKGLELVGIYGYDNEANKALMKMGAPYCAKSPDEFLGQVDAILVTARHGDLHYEYAMPYIRHGIPAFIDKPFCVDRKKAVELARAARAAKVSVCGGSPLRFATAVQKLAKCVKTPSENGLGVVLGGSVGSPLKWEEEYGGFIFYSQHLVEIILSVFGEDIKEVYAAREKDRCACIFRYEDYDVTGNYYLSFHYGISVYGTEGVLSESISPAQIEESLACELRDTVHMLDCGHAEQSLERQIYPLDIIYALDESMHTGKWARIHRTVL